MGLVTNNGGGMKSTSNTGRLERQEHSGEHGKIFPGKYQYQIFMCAFHKVFEFHKDVFVYLCIKLGGICYHWDWKGSCKIPSNKNGTIYVTFWIVRDPAVFFYRIHGITSNFAVSDSTSHR